LIREKTRQLIPLMLIVNFTLMMNACTVVKINDEQADSKGEYSTWTKTGTGFQAAEYVEKIWNDKLIPIYEEQSIDYETVIQALRDNRKGAIAQYGLTRQTGEPFYVFKVNGTALVMEYDNSSRNGVIHIDSNPVDGVADATLQVGPVIRGTVVRDSVEFIRFTDVGNQLQFADLANELNMKMKRDSIEKLDLNQIEGKTISYLGAFRLEEDQELNDIIVTPLRITIIGSDNE